ncbi:DUF302 domain-containing protein [Waterburya agarophytonicola K14]|uniref:DUF302 domain-containing protein n=1 Tax=Waterburya agarophytonicola KI4 TaxID=2874699 RepID=A0A964BQN1_9CYAN|nr:DUF302 domain-containing protein [Waterburya agarophytonicola]MCC0177799.1 DUF302 domain-containing protein [Waterburya agarophytonicola KI4]
MNSSLKFFLPILAISLASYGMNLQDNGLVTLASPYSVKETSDRLSAMIDEKSLTLFARIDHSKNAQNADLELNPTELLIFGNPQVGTPLMNCSITTAIDLPQKILVYQDEDRQTQIAYNQPEYLKQRHNIQGCDQVLDKVHTALKGIAEAATK